jgi:peptidoglycan/xylan/chitin deacetylase (PgdA/CDA1 family)
MLVEVMCPVGAAAGVLAYGVRGRSARLLAPSIWKGPSNRRAIALTFDDGPSESTIDVLRLLERFGVRATFFQCGHHVRRLPRAAVRVPAEGHEVGNHTDSHPSLVFRSPRFIYEQLERAQTLIADTTGVTPTWFRAPYGARWFGLAEAQKRLNLMGVMWTTVARDWKLPARGIVDYVGPRVAPGSILCFHDGRELAHHPNIAPTLEALEILIPRWLKDGYEITTLGGLLRAPAVPSVP